MWASGVITWLSSVGMPVLLKMETDQLVEQKWFDIFGANLWWFEVFLVILWVILLVNIIETVLSSLTQIFSKSKQDLLRNEIQFELYSKMKDMEIGRSMSMRYKYISQVIESYFPNISQKIINIPQVVIQFVIQLVWMVAIYAYFDIRLLFVVVISAVIGYFIEILSRRIAQKFEVDWKMSLGRQVWKYSNLFMYEFSQLAVSGWLLSTLRQYSNLLKEENKNSVQRDFSGLFWSVNNLINDNLRDIILKWIVGYGVFVGTNSVWMVVLVVSSMGTLGNLISQIFSLRVNYKDFMFEQESVLLMLKMSAPMGNISFDEILSRIEIKNLSFTYPNLAVYEQEYFEIVQKFMIGKNLWNSWLDDKLKNLIDTIQEDMKATPPEILKWVNLTFEQWKVYGVVGKNGEGKTTLMYLLSGFFQNYLWEMFYNGKNTKDFTTQSFLEKVSFLTQNPFVLDWASSIRENLFLWVHESVWEEKAWEYLEKFWLDKKIKKYKKWLDAEIGNDIDFSGGEKQIITFIRLLLQDRDVIVMDEGTNQLDAENEILVMNELLKYKQNKIIIFITHRMSTIAKVDEIYCLEQWVISATGNHTTLLQNSNNPYARFYKAQILHE